MPHNDSCCSIIAFFHSASLQNFRMIPPENTNNTVSTQLSAWGFMPAPGPKLQEGTALFGYVPNKLKRDVKQDKHMVTVPTQGLRTLTDSLMHTITSCTSRSN